MSEHASPSPPSMAGHGRPRLCKLGAILATATAEQRAQLERRLREPQGDLHVARVISRAGGYLHRSTAYRHRVGDCICSDDSTDSKDTE